MKWFFSVTFSLSCYLIYSQPLGIQLVKHSTDQYSNSFKNLGSARYLGMNNSMGALGGDISAISTNPAGTGVFIKSEVSGSLNLESYSNDVEFGNNNTYNGVNPSINQVGGVLSFVNNDAESKWKRLNVGIVFSNQNSNETTEFGANDNIILNDVSTGAPQLVDLKMDGHTKELEGNKSKLDISSGLNYNDKLYLGLLLSFHNSEIQEQSTYYDRNINTNDRFSYIYNSTPYTETATGFSVSVGAIAKVAQFLRIGTAYHSPVWWSSFNTEYNINQLDSFQSGGITNDIVAGNFDNFFDNQTLTAPSKLSFSSAVVIPNFAINVDYTMNFNSNIKFKPTDEFAENDLINNFIENNYELNVGAEFRIENLRLRGGFDLLI